MKENELNKKAIIDFKPIQPGDVKFTYSDSTKIKNRINYQHKISIKEGIKIGSKVIISAGQIVMSDIPSNSIFKNKLRRNYF